MCGHCAQKPEVRLLIIGMLPNKKQQRQEPSYSSPSLKNPLASITTRCRSPATYLSSQACQTNALAREPESDVAPADLQVLYLGM